ncbi:fimbrial protein [Buttiauxella gaviniae]|uniref:Fimbrial protein n=1 Tax=Buttiauxella gaviniae TaxID=82990 RepID=A0ABV3NYN2_9ENTR
MRFRYKFLSGALIALISYNALAAEMNAGKIHFTGEIIEPSCVIDGTDGTDSTVPLGTFPTSLFNDAGVGKESTLVPVDITLKDCPLKSDGLAAIQLTFNGTTTATASSTLLDVSKITTDGTIAATGVGIAMSPIGDSTTFIKFDGSDSQVYVQLPTTAGDTITASFNARYKSFTSTVTPGPADADLTVNILYR